MSVSRTYVENEQLGTSRSDRFLLFLPCVQEVLLTSDCPLWTAPGIVDISSLCYFYVQLDQRGETVYGFSKVHKLGVEIDFFDFGVGSHHAGLVPEKNGEHSIGDQMIGLNVEFT